MTSKDGTHSGLRNVVSKFTSHTAQKLQNQKRHYSFHAESLKSRIHASLLIQREQHVSYMSHARTVKVTHIFETERLHFDVFLKFCHKFWCVSLINVEQSMFKTSFWYKKCSDFSPSTNLYCWLVLQVNLFSSQHVRAVLCSLCSTHSPNCSLQLHHYRAWETAGVAQFIRPAFVLHSLSVERSFIRFIAL